LKKKKVKTKFIHLDDAGNEKKTSLIASIFGVWLMLARRLRVCNAGLTINTSREILIVVMMLYYKNVHSYKRHTVVRRVFCFW